VVHFVAVFFSNTSLIFLVIFLEDDFSRSISDFNILPRTFNFSFGNFLLKKQCKVEIFGHKHIIIKYYRYSSDIFNHVSQHIIFSLKNKTYP